MIARHPGEPADPVAAAAQALVKLKLALGPVVGRAGELERQRIAHALTTLAEALAEEAEQSALVSDLSGAPSMY